MVKTIHASLLIYLIITGFSVFAQTNYEIELLEGLGEEAEIILDELAELKENPLNLNSIGLKVLNQLPFITRATARAIINERNKSGRFRSWNSFLSRMHFDADQWSDFECYFYTGRLKPPKRHMHRLRNRNLQRLERPAGYKDGRYTGSPLKTLTRVSFFERQAFSSKWIMEKDPFEAHLHDHWAGYIETEHIPGIDRLIAGTFTVETGQGIILSGPYGLFKGADPIAPVLKREHGIRGLANAEENLYFSGLAAESAIQNNHFIFFASSHRVDASANRDGTISGLIRTGLHRVESELNNKKRVRQNVVGGRVIYSFSKGHIGTAGWAAEYDIPIMPSDSTRRRFVFRGSLNHVMGMDWCYSHQKWEFSGEIAVSKSGGMAGISNILYSMKNWTAVFSFRRADAHYHNPFSNVFAAAGISNIQGAYFGIKGKLHRKTSLSIHSDLIKHPWRTYFMPIPPFRHDLFLQIEHRQNKNTRFIFRLRNKRNDEYINRTMTEQHQINIRTELTYQCAKWLRIKSSFEWTGLSGMPLNTPVALKHRQENGRLFFADAQIRPRKELTVYTRIIFFNTDSWNSRVYAYENDLPGLFTTRAFHDKGIRYYFLFNLKCGQHIRIAGKLSRTIWPEKAFLGSGRDKIDTHTNTDAGLQIDLTW